MILSCKFQLFFCICLCLFWFPLIHCNISETIGYPPSIITEECTQVFNTYDFGHNRSMGKDEFAAFFRSLFAPEDRRYVTPKTVYKIFEYLDFHNTNQLGLSEFCKIFQHFVLPLIATRSSLFYCMPHSTFKMNNLNEQLPRFDVDQLNKSRTMFDIRQVYISDCDLRQSPHWNDKLSRQFKQINQVFPKVHKIEICDLEGLTTSISNKDFDQFVLYLDNIHDHSEAIAEFLQLNRQNQIPVVIVTSNNNSSREVNPLETTLESSIRVSTDVLTDRQDYMRYKMRLATILARKIYRRYHSSRYNLLL